MKLIGYKADNSTIEIPEKRFTIDGYYFADRLLEGVMFDVTFDDNDKIIKVETYPEDENYLSGLNMKKWEEAARWYAQRILDQGGDQVMIPKDLMLKYNVESDGGVE